MKTIMQLLRRLGERSTAIPTLRCLGILLGLVLTLGGGGLRPDPILESVSTWPGYHRGPALDVALVDHYAYVAIGEGGIQILDVKDPANPARVGEYCPPGRTEKVQIAGSRAYVATAQHRGGGCEGESWKGVVLILDVTDASNPVLLGSYQTTGQIKALAVQANRLYISDQNDGLHVVDTSSPSRPKNLGIARPDWSWGFTAIWADEKRAYLGYYSECKVMDLANPGSPILITNLSSSEIRGIYGTSNWLYVAERGQPGRLSIYVLGTNAVPVLAGRLEFTNSILSLQVSGDRAYMASAEAGFLVADISNPHNPVLLGSIAVPGVAVAAQVSGTNAFVADFLWGLQIIDLQNPKKMLRTGSYDTGLTARHVRVDNARAFLVSSDTWTDGSPVSRSYLEIIDVRNPTQPIRLSTYEQDSETSALDVSGDLVGLALLDSVQYSGQLELLDVSNPAQPVSLSRTAMADTYRMDVKLSETYAYVTREWEQEFRVYNIANPGEPVLVSSTPCGGTLVEVSGTNIYIDNGWQLEIYDASNLKVPVFVNSTSFNDDGREVLGGLSVRGGFAYSSLGWNGFNITDVRNPTNLFVLGYYDTFGQVRDLWSDTHNLLVAEGWYGIELFDVNDPAKPMPLGRCTMRSQALGLDVVGNYAYVAGGGGGLSVFALPSGSTAVLGDIVTSNVGSGETATLTVHAYGRGSLKYQWFMGESGDTSHPISGANRPTLTTSALSGPESYWVRVSSTSGVSDSRTAWVNVVPPVSVDLVGLWPGYRRGSVQQMEVSGNLAYLGLQNGALLTCDFADPTAPQITGFYDPKSSSGGGVALASNLVFLAAGEKGLHVLDVTDPSQPIRVGLFKTNSSINKVRLAGNYAYVLGDQFRTLDISNPQLIREVGYVEVGGNDLSIAGGYAYVANWGPLAILDITDPAQPRNVGNYYPGESGSFNCVRVSGKYAYVSFYSYGNPSKYMLQVLDISNPAQVRFVSSLDMKESASSLSVAGTNVYITDGYLGLKVVDIANPASPKLVRNVSNNQYLSYISVVGDRAYAGNWEGVYTLDVRQPANPTWTGYVQTAGSCSDVSISGNHAYLAEGDTLDVLDVSSPADPSRVATYPMGAYHLAISGDRLYKDGIQVLDISKPTQPQLLGELLNDYSSDGSIVVRDGYVFQGGFTVLDARNPANISVLSRYPQTPASQPGMSFSGIYAYLSWGWGGLHMLDLSDLTLPRRVGAYYSDGPVNDAAIREDYAYVVLGSELPSLEVVDISDPRKPRCMHRLPLPSTSNIKIVGTYAFVTGEGLKVLDIADPKRPVLVGSNPSISGTTLMQVVGDLVYVSAGEYGLATYRVTPQLKLNQPVVSSEGLLLSWLGGPGIRLQQNTNLNFPEWQDVPNSEGASAVNFPAKNASGYFRLIKP